MTVGEAQYLALPTQSTAWRRIHSRVRRTFGSPSLYLCNDCDGPACDWTWIHGKDPYNIENYEPRCKSCHMNYDMNDEWRENNARYDNTNSRGKSQVFTECDVLEIRRIYSQGVYNINQLARIYAVSNVSINKIVHRKSWAHI